MKHLFKGGFTITAKKKPTYEEMYEISEPIDISTLDLSSIKDKAEMFMTMYFYFVKLGREGMAIIEKTFQEILNRDLDEANKRYEDDSA